MPKINKAFAATAFSFAGALLLSACGGGDQSDAPVKQPVSQNNEEDGFAQYADDAAIGKAGLSNAIAPFFEDEALDETRALVIMHGGKLIAERYAPGFGPDSKLIGWSMSKTVTATLIGLMIADGRLALDEPAPVPEWKITGDGRNKITLRHLLHMTSGLDHVESADEEIPLYDTDTARMMFMDGRENTASFAKNRVLEAAAGSKFEYSTASTTILADIMARSLTDSEDPVQRRDAMIRYAKGRLFVPLGMDSMTMEFDRAGTMLGGAMIHASARDWAKLAEFIRNNGSVRGAQLLPTRWTRFMRTSSKRDAAYGGHLWLNKPRPDGRNEMLFPGKAPENVFAMLGRNGQMVVSSPGDKLTIVRLGITPDDAMGPLNDQMARIIGLFSKN